MPRIALGVLIATTTALIFASCLFLIRWLDMGQSGDIIAFIAVAIGIRFSIFYVWRRFTRQRKEGS